MPDMTDRKSSDQGGLNHKMSRRVSGSINSQGPSAFVQVDNRTTHPNEPLLSAMTEPLFVPTAILSLSFAAEMSLSGLLSGTTYPSTDVDVNNHTDGASPAP